MTTVAVIGAGGKMGFRVTQKIRDSRFDLHAIEIGEPGRARLAEAGIAVMDEAEGLAGADVVILAVPDDVLGDVARKVVENAKAGTMIFAMDAAAPYAGVLPDDRPDLTYFVAHPCHPPIFNDLDDREQRKDQMGGIAPQNIVCALFQGPEEHYALGEEVARVMWAPIIKAHRVTTEHLAILEPGLSEMVALPFVDIMHKAVDVCAEQGVPREAAFDFLMGHLNVELAMWFGFRKHEPSQAAERLLKWATPHIVRDDWDEVLRPPKVGAACRMIAGQE